IAMYQAKGNIDSFYEIYNNHMDYESLRKFLLLKDLRKAVENNELTLFFQPVINMDTMQIVSVEALVRWCHPSLGTVSPGEFIPLAEESGLIIRIGDWVLNKACEQTKEWQEAGFP
ncbi:EAL domain-containing protein, partial [Pseudomonas sp. 2822-17]|uniref:EAL domain-containing protein n=1 Tax=Pseudomonas sp. 2822-17 TaxID=1712678 RepID=UPI000C549573